MLQHADIDGKDVLVVGDVHGCLEELKELIAMITKSLDDVVFVFCGDIINKGPYSVETLRYVRSLPHVHVVRGNHEEHVLKHCKDIAKNSIGVADLSKKYQWIRELTPDDIYYLEQLPYTISIPSLGAIVVHAGLYPWKPLEHQNPRDMVLMRNIVDADGERPYASSSLDCGLPWASSWAGPEHVYFGHDARRGLQRYRFVTGLDTGCVYGSALTAVFINTKQQFLVVPAKHVHQQPKETIPKPS